MQQIQEFFSDYVSSISNEQHQCANRGIEEWLGHKPTKDELNNFRFEDSINDEWAFFVYHKDECIGYVCTDFEYHDNGMIKSGTVKFQFARRPDIV